MILATTRPTPGRHKSTGCGLFDLACAWCEDDVAPIQAARIAADAKSHRSPKHSHVHEEWFDDLCARETEGAHRAEAAAFERACGMSAPETPADVLDAAADYIDEHGWIQHAMYQMDGSCCALGAIDAVADLSSSPACRAEAALYKSIDDSFISVWNDAPNQTAANVTATLRRVAAELRETS